MLVGLLALTVLAPPMTRAHAAELSFNDPRGDASARYDITEVALRNDSRRVAARLEIANLRRGEQIVRIIMDSVRADLHWYVTTVVQPNGRVTAELETFNGSGFKVVPCEVVGAWRFASDVVNLSFPQSCLDIHRALRVSAVIGAGDGSSGDPADFTRTVRVPYA